MYNKENSKSLLKQRSTGHQSEEVRKDEQVPAKTNKHTGLQSEENRKDDNKMSVCKKRPSELSDDTMKPVRSKLRREFGRTRTQ